MTWTAYWRAIVRAARTGLDIYASSVILTIVSNFVKVEGWYIVPLAAIVSGIFKGLREKHPDSWVWEYIPL